MREHLSTSEVVKRLKITNTQIDVFRETTGVEDLRYTSRVVNEVPAIRISDFCNGIREITKIRRGQLDVISQWIEERKK